MVGPFYQWAEEEANGRRAHLMVSRGRLADLQERVRQQSAINMEIAARKAAADEAAAQRAHEMEMDRRRRLQEAAEFNARGQAAADAEYYEHERRKELLRMEQDNQRSVRRDQSAEARRQAYRAEMAARQQIEAQRERDELLHDNSLESSQLASQLRLDEMPVEYDLRGRLVDREAANQIALDQQQQQGRLAQLEMQQAAEMDRQRLQNEAAFNLEGQRQQGQLSQLDRQLTGQRDMARENQLWQSDESQLGRDAERLGQAEELQQSLMLRGYTFSKPAQERRQQLINQRALILKNAQQGNIRPGVVRQMLRPIDEEMASLIPDQPPDLAVGGGQLVEHPQYGLLTIDRNGQIQQVARPPAGRGAGTGTGATSQQKLDPLMDQAIKIYQSEMGSSLDGAGFDQTRLTQIYNGLRAMAGQPPADASGVGGGQIVPPGPSAIPSGAPTLFEDDSVPPPGWNPNPTFTEPASNFRWPESSPAAPAVAPRAPAGSATVAPSNTVESIRSVATSFQSGRGPTFDGAIRKAAAAYAEVAGIVEAGGPQAVNSLTPEQMRRFREAADVLRRAGVLKSGK